MNIIRVRLEKALALTQDRSVYNQTVRGGRRRGSYRNGVHALPLHMTTRMTQQMMNRLDALCARLNCERGMIVRDALEFYLGMAEAEFAEHGDSNPVPTRKKREPYGKRV
jgi:hypothetical protein